MKIMISKINEKGNGDHHNCERRINPLIPPLQKKAMKYGVPLAAMGAGGYMVHKGMKKGFHGGWSSGSGSGSGSSEEE